MLQLKSPEIRQDILNLLKNGADMNAIIVEICEKTGAPWEEVRVFIEQIAVENKDDITLSPLYISFTLGLFFGGVALLGYAAYVFIYGLYLGNREILSTTASINEAGGISPLEAVFIGFLLIFGNFKGVVEVWGIILKRGNIL